MFKKKFLIFYLLLFSCTLSQNFYEKTGFAYINDGKKVFSSLPKGTLIKVTNVKTSDSKVIVTDEIIRNLESRIISLPYTVSKDLKLNRSLPLVHLQSLRKNKIFIAKKTKIYEEEKKIKNNIKLEKISILDLNKKKNTNNRIYLNFGPFYYKRYADQIYDTLNKKFNKKNIIFKDYNDKNYLITFGPLNNLKEYDKIYTKLVKIGLIGFDIKIQ
tara:strand:- start:26228 stop:26872 length:645 start_codon:yes stop_codon:yes gene_type:complete